MSLFFLGLFPACEKIPFNISASDLSLFFFFKFASAIFNAWDNSSISLFFLGLLPVFEKIPFNNSTSDLSLFFFFKFASAIFNA